MTRITEDGHIVTENEKVWEIMYQYVNPEVSEPYAEQREVKKIPGHTRIWFHKFNCDNHIEVKKYYDTPAKQIGRH